MADDVKSVILAAGVGARMKSELPKVLHRIFSKPLLGWVLDAVKSFESIVVTGYKAEAVNEYLEKFPNAASVFQDKQLGTGHALMCAAAKLKDFKGKVLILCGDTPLISPKTIEAFLESHKEHGASLSVMTAIFEDSTGYGRIIRSENGSVKAIIEEKDATEAQRQIKEVNAGVYCLNWEEISPALKDLKSTNAQNEYYLTDIVSWAASKGLKTHGYTLLDNREIFGINSREHLAIATEFMRERKIKELMQEGVTIVQPETTSVSPDTTVGNDTVIYPDTFINGKNTIGKNCKIGPFAHIRGGCTVGDNVKIGNFVELKSANVGSNTNVSHLSYVGDAQVGEGVNIGAGTITANYNSVTKVKSTTVIEDGTSIGSNSVLVAPVTLGENAFVAAGSVVTKSVGKNALAIARGSQKNIENWIKE